MTLRTLSAFTGAAALMLAFAGCTSAPKINSEFDKDANFSGYKTYAVAPLPKKIENTDPGLLMRIEPTVKTAVRDSLTGKGLNEIMDLKSADIAVLVHGKVVPKTDVTDWGMAPMPSRYGWYRGYPYGAYGGSNITVDQYEEGTISIEIYEVATKKLVWVGWVTGRKGDDADKTVERVDSAIRSILATYPPGSAPAK